MVEETRNNKTKASGTSDEAVRRRTGRGWQEWFEILDRAGAKDMDHKSIVAYLKENHAISSWWQQQVTVTYEQERGLRKVHQMADGYQISRSKTINVPLSDLYAAWEDEDRRTAGGLGRPVSKFERPAPINPCVWPGISRVEL
jgi:hypothetical protein